MVPELRTDIKAALLYPYGLKGNSAELAKAATGATVIVQGNGMQTVRMTAGA